MKEKLLKIGFWYSEREPNLPHPKDFVDSDMSEERKAKLIRFFESGIIVARYRGWANCRICGEGLGTCDMKNGKFLYPQKLEHYIKEHNVDPFKFETKQ